MSLRNSFDKILDPRGEDILEYCVSAGLRILNGRKIGDSLGHYTCHKWNGSSVVDYTLVSESIFDDIEYFKVGKALLDLSDHCSLALKIKTSSINRRKQNITLNALPDKFIWDNKNIYKFQEALSSTEIQQNIQSFLDKPISDTNIAAKFVTSIIKTAAQKSLRVKKHIKSKERLPDKKWHDMSLKRLRRSLTLKGELLTKYPYDPQIRGSYFLCLKSYRKLCKQKHRQFRHDLINQLETLHDTNPQAYWKLLKNLKGDSEENVTKIDPLEWLTHFKNLSMHV